jgi:Ni2+-binding GTPase involved in maturation of urease and hydrogenase
MKLITLSGPPSSGKTAVLVKCIEGLLSREIKVGVVKFDCLYTDDDLAYAKLGVPVHKGLSGSQCPDHYFISNVEEVLVWGKKKKLDVLFTESAGLCNRCSPYINDVMSVCVIDNLSGVNTPKKIGPMLKMADVVIITKGDIVSQAEREVFSSQVAAVNSKALIMNINGLTGQGAYELGSWFIDKTIEVDTLIGKKLRYPMPSALCSYCLGEMRVGDSYQMGNVKKIKLED